MAAYLENISEGSKPDPYIKMSQWAAENFVLPQESSAEYGKIRIERTPFIKEILDELSPMSPTEEVVLVKPSQQAGTTIAIIFMFCVADLYPGPLLFLTLNDKMAIRFSKKRIGPSLKLMPSLREKIRDPKIKSSGNTLLFKEFPGGSWILAGSNAATSYRQESVRYVILDDFDGFDSDIEGEGDPGELIDRRTGSFSNSKIFKNSTPTILGTSNILIAYGETSQGLFCVPCTQCGEFQYLKFGTMDSDFGIKWITEDDEIVDVWYQCKICQARINEHEKPWMFSRGKYIHAYPQRLKRGFMYNALYSPLGWKNNWKKIAEKFIVAKRLLKTGQPARMKTWMNTLMTEGWEERGNQPEWEELFKRKEDYAGNQVPEGALLLTCGVDVQENRLIVLIKGWGPGEENWKIFHTEIYGDPVLEGIWKQLDVIINATYIHASGTELSVMSVCVDSGYLSNIVYNYCRVRQPRVHAIKGARTPGSPVIGSVPTAQDVTFNGERIKEGVLLWRVGSDTAKDIIYSRLKLSGIGSGVYHWGDDTDEEYFKQLTAEKKVIRFVKGYQVHEWHQMRPNHVLDVDVYAYAAALKFGMNHPGFFEALEKYIHGGDQTDGPGSTKKGGEPEKKNSWLGGGGGLMSGRRKWLG